VKSLGTLLIILFSSLIQYQKTVTVYEFAKAAVEDGHEVTVFCDLDAVYNLMANQISSDQKTPKKLAELIPKGVHFLACMESARLRGIDSKKALIKGAIESSLGELALLMDQSDRVVAFSS
jgi:sulfur relay (sulfurtransferase) complex TusBCD TusD component (DsrE family)